MIVMQKLSNDDQIVQPNLIANCEIYKSENWVALLENIATVGPSARGAAESRGVDIMLE